MLGHDEDCILAWSCKGKCTCGYDQWQIDNKPTHTLVPIEELTTLKADCKRLRDALEEIEKYICKGYGGSSQTIVDIARKALKEGQDG